jgi:adenylate cyclase
VLFTDFKEFTKISSTLTPTQLVRELDFYFSSFDRIIGKHNLEKLKTIGESYMCAGGLPKPSPDHVINSVNAAWDIILFMEKLKRKKLKKGEQVWEIRVGIHTGPLIAGVIGHKKFAYDIWGDMVNVASRLESNGEPGKINI